MMAMAEGSAALTSRAKRARSSSDGTKKSSGSMDWGKRFCRSPSIPASSERRGRGPM